MIASSLSWLGGWLVWGREPAFIGFSTGPAAAVPDPCALLPADELSRQLPLLGRAAGSVRERRETGRDAPSCDYVLAGRRLLSVSVTGTDDRRFRSWADHHGGRLAVVGLDDYLASPAAGSAVLVASPSATALFVRKGRLLVQLASGTFGTQDLFRVAAVMASHLKALPE